MHIFSKLQNGGSGYFSRFSDISIIRANSGIDRSCSKVLFQRFNFIKGSLASFSSYFWTREIIE